MQLDIYFTLIIYLFPNIVFEELLPVPSVRKYLGEQEYEHELSLDTKVNYGNFFQFFETDIILYSLMLFVN